jgi:hypothetical protein
MVSKTATKVMWTVVAASATAALRQILLVAALTGPIVIVVDALGVIVPVAPTIVWTETKSE